MTGYSVEVSKTDLAEVERALTGIKNGYAKVVSRSLNRTITGVRTDAVREIQMVITPTAKTIRATFTMIKASPRKLTAAVKSSGNALPLIEYRARATKKGVTVQVKKKSKRSLISRAFIATMKSGHKGVFFRDYIFNLYPARKARHGVAYATMPRKYRLPIEELYGPGVPDILSNDSVMKPILKKANERLHKELGNQLNYELSKL
jgi:hypothetical protein